MVKVEGLQDLGVKPEVVRVLKKDGIKELYDWQFDVFKSTDVLKGKNLIVSVPTGAGKTVIAKVLALQKYVESKGKVFYIAPLRSLAIEKYNEFRRWKKILGVDVKISTGGFSSSGNELANANIVVTTFEKFESLMRHRARWIQNVDLLIVDEIHSINEVERGAILENILIWAKDNCQILGLSATVENLDEIASWLNAQVYTNAFRPVDLKKGVFYNGKIYWHDNSVERIKGGRDWKNLVVDRVLRGDNVIVFVNRRNGAEASARKIALELAKAKFIVPEIADEITNEVDERFGGMLLNGVAFHHGGLSNSQRLWVEDMFRRRLLKVVVATPTLAMGVNLPADVVIIKGLARFVEGKFEWLDVMDVWQMMGRAGRPGISKHGEAILLVNKKSMINDVMNRYVYGRLERVVSRIVLSKQFIGQVLGLMTSFGYSTVDEIVQHYQDSLFMHQVGHENILRNHVKRAINWLVDNMFVDEEAMAYGSYEYYEEMGSVDEDEYKQYSVNEFGMRTAELYILPHTAVMFQGVFQDVQERQDEIGVFHVVARCPDMELPPVRQDEFGKYWEDMHYVLSKSYLDVGSINSVEDLKCVIGEYKVVSILEDWINDVDIDEIAKRYGVGKGDVTKIIEYGEWLVYSFAELYRVEYGKDDVYKWLKDLSIRVKYGVPDYLVPLVKVRGIGRKTAYKLWQSGIRSVEDLKKIGKARASELGIKQKTLDMMFGSRE